MRALLPSLPPGTPDDIEATLVRAGFFCVATGAVGDVHKFYFAGRLCHPNPAIAEWLMLELILHYPAATAQATFRCDAQHQLLPLSQKFAALLGDVMRTSFSAA